MNGLPLWAQALNLLITLALAGLRSVEFFRRGLLEVRLTRDSFFRLTDFGEALFVHGVLLSRNGPVLIQNVSITLRRLASKDAPTAEKSFPLEIIGHGEKVKGPAYTAEHHFYGASPLMYVEGSSTQRPVYHCLHSEYKERQRQAVMDFDQDLFAFKRQVDEAAANDTPRSEPEILRELQQLVRPHFEKMCGLIQLEAGEYELSLEISYEKCGLLTWKRHDSANSYGYFTVEESGIAAYKNELLKTLYVRTVNVMKNRSDLVVLPVFQPNKFTEARKRLKGGSPR